MVCVFASCCYVWLCKNNVWGACAGAEVSEAKRRRTVSDASEGGVEICKHHIGVFVYITTKLMFEGYTTYEFCRHIYPSIRLTE